MSQRKSIDDLVEELKKVKSASSNAQKDQIVEELYRLGKSLDVKDLKDVIACACGPNGEKGGSVNW